MGSRFSIVDFHETVLGSGAVPLTVLADNVARWRAGIEQQKVVELIHDIEQGRRTCEVRNLAELAEFVATRAA